MNTYRTTEEYQNNIQKIKDGTHVPVFQRYLIVVCPQDDMIKKFDNATSSTQASELITAVVNQIPTWKGPIVSVIDYHGKSTLPDDEHICRFSQFTHTGHNQVNNAGEAAVTVTKDFRDAVSNKFVSHNFYGFIERNGDNEDAPLTNLLNIIEDVTQTHTQRSLDTVVFPPEFHIKGLFIEDMITPIALELRKRYPNSVINVDYCLSILHIPNGSYSKSVNDAAVSRLEKMLSTYAETSIDDVCADINK